MPSPISFPERLDLLRAAKPDLGFAIYAMEPGGLVTFEVHAGGEVYTFVGETLEAAMTTAFPVSVEPPAPEPAVAEKPHDIFT